MAKKDYRTKVIVLGVDPNSPHLGAFEAEGGEDKFLAFRSIVRKYPNMAKEEAAEKALLFNKDSAQILDYAVRKKIDLTLEDALSFKVYQKMAFIFAHMNKIDLTLSEAFQITNMDQCNRFKFLIKAGYGKEDALALRDTEGDLNKGAVEEVDKDVEIIIDNADSAPTVVPVEESVPVVIVDDTDDLSNLENISTSKEDEVQISGVGAGEGDL